MPPPPPIYMQEVELTQGAYVFIGTDHRLSHDNLPSWEVTHLVVPTDDSIKILSIEEFFNSISYPYPHDRYWLKPFHIISCGHTKEEAYDLIGKEKKKIENEILTLGAKEVRLLYWSPEFAYEYKNSYIAEIECFMIGTNE